MLWGAGLQLAPFHSRHDAKPIRPLVIVRSSLCLDESRRGHRLGLRFLFGFFQELSDRLDDVLQAQRVGDGR